jgi:hypothetical protein
MTSSMAIPGSRRDRLWAVGAGDSNALAPLSRDLGMACCDGFELQSVEVAYLAGRRAVVHVVQPSLTDFLR